VNFGQQICDDIIRRIPIYTKGYEV